MSQLHILCRDCPRVCDFPKLSFLFFFPYPPSVSPSLPNETGQHFADVLIGHHSHLFPVGNLFLPPFPFPLSHPFEITKGKKEGRKMEKGGGCQVEKAMSDSQ